MAPEGARMAQDVHKTAQEAPSCAKRGLQEGAMMAQVAPKTAQGAPRRPKMASRWPKVVSRDAKMASRWLQDGPKVARASSDSVASPFFQRRSFHFASRFHANQVTGSERRSRSDRSLRVSKASFASGGAERSLGRGVWGETRAAGETALGRRMPRMTSRMVVLL